MQRGDLAAALTQEQQFFLSTHDPPSLSFMIGEVKRLWSIADPYRTAAFAGMRINDPKCDRLRDGHARILGALVDRDVETIVEQVVTGRDRVVQYVRGDDGALQPGTGVVGWGKARPPMAPQGSGRSHQSPRMR